MMFLLMFIVFVIFGCVIFGIAVQMSLKDSDEDCETKKTLALLLFLINLSFIGYLIINLLN